MRRDPHATAPVVGSQPAGTVADGQRLVTVEQEMVVASRAANLEVGLDGRHRHVG
jgi:hypothetical protein